MHHFILDDLTSSSLGVRVAGLVEIPASTRVVEDIEVLSRAGTLTRWHGWQDNQVRIPIWIRPPTLSNYTRLANLLTTATRLRLSTQDGRYRKIKHARLSPLTPVTASLGSAEILFTCEPFVYHNQPITITTTSNSSFNNPGSLPAAPIITVTGTGRVSFTLNEQTFLVNAPSGSLTIDSELLTTHVAGAIQTDGLTSTSFPMLKPGINTIKTSTGTTKIEVVFYPRDP